MKKIFNIIILVIGIMVFPAIVNAASADIYASSYNCYVGDSVTVTVSFNSCGWNLHVSGQASKDIAGVNFDGENQSGGDSFSVPTGSPGTYTYTLSGDVTDADETKVIINKTITVTVSERPAPEPEPQPDPQPQQPQQPQPSQPSQPSYPTQQQQQSNPEPQQQKEQETKQEEKKEEKPKEDPIVVENIEIVGFNISFSKKKTSYILNIDEDVEKLYITTKSNAEADVKDGVVDVKGKNSVVITFKKGTLTAKYTIKLVRGNTTRENVDDSAAPTKKEDDSNKKDNNIFLYTTIGFAGLSVLLLFALIASKKKPKKIEPKPVAVQPAPVQPAVQPQTVTQPTVQPQVVNPAPQPPQNN